MDYVNVALSVTGRVTTENVYHTIVESVRRIKGIDKVSWPSGTNTIEVSVHWLESEVEDRLQEIKCIADVENVFTNCKNKSVHRTHHDKVDVFDVLSFEIIKDPIGEVNGAKKDKDYFKALTYTCAVFEHYGKQILLRHFQENKKQVGGDRLERLTLESVIVMLYTHSIINEPVYSKMFGVTHLRNMYMHRGRGIKFSPDQLQKADEVTNVGLDCLKTLKSIYEGKNIT
jgi:hypothetical protein